MPLTLILQPRGFWLLSCCGNHRAILRRHLLAIVSRIHSVEEYWRSEQAAGLGTTGPPTPRPTHIP
jgi:hypothetical protein